MNKPHTVILHESTIGSILSDTFTFLVVSALILLADGKSNAWQVITIGMFVFFVYSKVLLKNKIFKFYSKRDLLKWVNSLPDDDKGGEA